MPPLPRPDVLVLAGGGVLGEAWMNGLLAGLEDAGEIDMRELESYVGTSAGSIVAAQLTAGRRPRRPRGGLKADQAGERAAPAPAALELIGSRAAAVLGRALPYEGRAGSAARAALLRAVPRGRHDLSALERSFGELRFDGRLRVVAVERRSGRRVVFGMPGAPAAAVGRAVVASCSIPGYFAPVTIGEREYVDGGVWSITNLDVAPALRDTRVLCLSPFHGLPLSRSSPLQLLRGRLGAELALLRRRGAEVRLIGPWSTAAGPMARNPMNGGHRAEVLAAGYAQGLAEV